MEMNSPAPGTPQTPTKAYWALIVSFVGAFGTSLLAQWTDTDPLQARDFVVALVFALVTGGLTGGVTYQVRNRRV